VPDLSRGEQLDVELLDAVADLFRRMVKHGEQLARELAVPPVLVKALHLVDCPMAMKDLGRRMNCDPSFATMIADMLEKHGLARREPNQGDRRIKNLVLTAGGQELRSRVEREVAARMPWHCGLNVAERTQLLALVRKMLDAEQARPAAPQASGEVETQLANAFAASG
jgi:DNA-binding MarR family transcriptional regulator